MVYRCVIVHTYTGPSSARHCQCRHGPLRTGRPSRRSVTPSWAVSYYAETPFVIAYTCSCTRRHFFVNDYKR